VLKSKRSMVFGRKTKAGGQLKDHALTCGATRSAAGFTLSGWVNVLTALSMPVRVSNRKLRLSGLWRRNTSVTSRGPHQVAIWQQYTILAGSPVKGNRAIDGRNPLDGGKKVEMAYFYGALGRLSCFRSRNPSKRSDESWSVRAAPSQ